MKIKPNESLYSHAVATRYKQFEGSKHATNMTHEPSKAFRFLLPSNIAHLNGF